MRVDIGAVAHLYGAKYGVPIYEVAGWRGRGKEFPSRPDGALRHWTAGPKTGVKPSIGICTNGRGGANPLPGPLCQLFQERASNGRDGLWIIADGIANHAGTGEWNGIRGANSVVLGMEIEWSGPNESFSVDRQFVSEVGMLILMELAAGTNMNDACEHREWALPRGRKIDTNLDGNELRARLAQMKAGGGSVPPVVTPPVTPPSHSAPSTQSGDGMFATTIGPNNVIYEAMVGTDSGVYVRSGDNLIALSVANAQPLGGLAKSVNIYFHNGTLVVSAHGMDDQIHYRAFGKDWKWTPWVASKNIKLHA